MSNPSVTKLINALSQPFIGLAGEKWRAIDMQTVRSITAQSGLSRRDVEIACLERKVIPIRYVRNIGTIGIEGQLKLLRAAVCVCGAGGLGGTIIELLARQGIGRLTVIDNGDFDETNLNRQLYATEKNLGKSKVKVAAARVKQINAAVLVKPVQKTIQPDNVDALIRGAGAASDAVPDVVIDALDNFTARRLVAETCARLKIPFVHGAIAGFVGEVMTIFPGDRGCEVFTGTDKTGKQDSGIEMYTGNPAATPAIIAAWEVQEAVKLITGIGTPIRNHLLFLDTREGSIDEIPLG